MSTPNWSRLGTGGVLAGLLLLAYVTVWRPARAVLVRHAAYPVLAAIDTERAHAVQLKRGRLSVRLHASDPSVASGNFRAPAGILFLLPALFLAAFAPYRPYWLYFWGFHLGLGTLQLGAVAVGMGWADWGFALNELFRSYVTQGLSLAAPVFALYGPALLSDTDANTSTTNA